MIKFPPLILQVSSPTKIRPVKMSSSSPLKPRIAVVGAGVIGLSVGLCLTEMYGSQLDLTIIADKFSPNTTSDRAGAVFIPGGNYVPGGSDSFEEDAVKWERQSFNRFKYLHDTAGEDMTGIQINPCYKFYDRKQPSPWFKDMLLDFKELSELEAKTLDLPYEKFETIWSFRTVIIKGETYLPWMMRKIKENGGQIVQHKVVSLVEPELATYDIIINCTGLGARDLVADESDDTLFPVRGQLVTVKAPWVKTIYHHREHDLSSVAYVIPRKDVIILGGTSEPKQWSTIPDPKVAEEIYRKCLKLAPELKGAEVVGGWACLRPVRRTVRLEIEDTSQSFPLVIHNYGHGGHGVILSWGCALDTVKLVHSCLERKGVTLQTVSKL